MPSATLWLAWKARRPAAAPIPALAFADPPLRKEGIGREERVAVAIFSSGLRLGPLPYAREESAAVVRALGGGSVRSAWARRPPKRI